MARVFPYFSDGDPLEPVTINDIYRELERWRKAQAVPPMIISGAEGDTPPIFSVQVPKEGVYFCQPGSSVAGASGTWPAITAVSFAADIYKVVGSKITKFAASATIRNWYAAGLDANKTTNVRPDGSGAWVAIAESCT